MFIYIHETTELIHQQVFQSVLNHLQDEIKNKFFLGLEWWAHHSHQEIRNFPKYVGFLLSGEKQHRSTN